ncbi:YppG family protein [Halalkalibacter alkaliphilus]|uniref:YppG family protein n=1 Tax=Halalkalibacter alkaliphilus TaxID=2917993 RepID=A0A9X2CSX2_9BACI|nr:YppG family protein [Halalkalibacter alkaliphilus]MCL7747404.1 YppG family protein [Halalkalibacter alkaliphilus]
MFQPNQNHQRPMGQRPPQFHNPSQYQQPFSPFGQQPFHHQPPHQMNGFIQPMQQGPGRPRPPFPPGMGMGKHPGYKPNKPSFFKSAFTNESGKFDMGKTVSTVDQVVKTVHQASPIVKTIGSLFAKK